MDQIFTPLLKIINSLFDEISGIRQQEAQKEQYHSYFNPIISELYKQIGEDNKGQTLMNKLMDFFNGPTRIDIDNSISIPISDFILEHVDYLNNRTTYEYISWNSQREAKEKFSDRFIVLFLYDTSRLAENLGYNDQIISILDLLSAYNGNDFAKEVYEQHQQELKEIIRQKKRYINYYWVFLVILFIALPLFIDASDLTWLVGLTIIGIVLSAFGLEKVKIEKRRIETYIMKPYKEDNKPSNIIRLILYVLLFIFITALVSSNLLDPIVYRWFGR